MAINLTETSQQEWLEADGLGGYASGTVSGIRTRRYHALLLAATRPPAGRIVLVNGFDASLETANGNFALSSQVYPAEITHPDGARRIVEFTVNPWPKWLFALDDGAEIEQEIFVVHGAPVVVLSWRLATSVANVKLTVRPFLSGRDYHSLHHENPAFQFQPEISSRRVTWHPYGDKIPAIIAAHNGVYQHHPDWYRNFLYAQERERGLDFTEDLAAPGSFQFDLSAGEAVLIFAAQDAALGSEFTAGKLIDCFRAAEKERRASFASPIERSADAYLVRRGEGQTIVAGYPWFTDWGRDTFISLRGLCLATGRIDVARDILLEWSNVVSDGMLPNRFPDEGEFLEYNSVDASLWYIVAAHDLLAAVRGNDGMLSAQQRESLHKTINAILTGYAGGTRYGIRMDEDGLLAAGVPGTQLTWMDAKIGDSVVTPRIGKPVEIQALWLNALWVGSQIAECWKEPLTRGMAALRQRFWNQERGCLFDVIDLDHERGKVDGAFRPNQIFAVGGLPLALIEGERAKRIVGAVEQRLWTPLGLRSLAPEEPGYKPRYRGGVSERDGAYHQGIVWPWLMGPFVEAWVRSRGASFAAKCEARARFLSPLFEHLKQAGLGHISEIFDAEAPYTPRGCPFQAWSLAELLRLDRVVLAE